ncbi:MAG: PP2C family protein-serine/threonine phosphatase [Desulfomonilia bacterium]
MWGDDFIFKLSDSLASGLLVISPDSRVVLWNTAAETITSIYAQDIVNRPVETAPAAVKILSEGSSGEVRISGNCHDSRLIQEHISVMDVDDIGLFTVVSFSDVTRTVAQRENLERLLLSASQSRDTMEKQASSLATSIAELEEKNEIIEAQHRKMLTQMEMAARLQKSLLPDIYRNFNGVIFSSKFVPSIHIGGDLYDVVDLGHGLTGFIIADVSGHGVASALISSMFKMSFHNLAETVASPKILFHMLNQELRNVLSEDYITAFYVLSDRYAKTITFTNAGHPAPLLYRKETSEIVELDTDGLFLGMFEDGLYGEMTLDSIEDGDALLLYTDCILEAENAEGKQYGKSRLKELFLKTMRETHGQDIIERIESDVRKFAGKDAFDDDFTVLLLEFWDKHCTVSCSEEPGDDSLTPSDDKGFVEF